MAKMTFLTVKNFFCAFSKLLTKGTFVRLLFLKLNQSWNTKKKIVGGVFFKNQKRTFSGVQNGTFQKSNFKFVFLHLFFFVKGSSMPIFTKNIDIWVPWNFLKMKTLTCAGTTIVELDFYNHVWPLVTWPVLYDQIKIPHSTLMGSRDFHVQYFRKWFQYTKAYDSAESLTLQ